MTSSWRGRVVLLGVAWMVVVKALIQKHSNSSKSTEIVGVQHLCKSHKFEETLTLSGCEDVVVKNYFCYGQCQSSVLPPASDEGDGMSWCTACKPESTWRNVTFHCDDGKTKSKLFEFFDDCKCVPLQCTTQSPQVTTFIAKVTTGHGAERSQPCKQICRKCRKMKRELEQRMQSNKTERNVAQHYNCINYAPRDCKKLKVFQRRAFCQDCKLCKKGQRSLKAALKLHGDLGVILLKMKKLLSTPKD